MTLNKWTVKSVKSYFRVKPNEIDNAIKKLHTKSTLLSILNKEFEKTILRREYRRVNMIYMESQNFYQIYNKFSKEAFKGWEKIPINLIYSIKRISKQ